MRQHLNFGCICLIELLIRLALAVLLHRKFHPVGTANRLLPSPNGSTAGLLDGKTC